MASVELTDGKPKRSHVKTEKMQEYMRSHGDGGTQKVHRCPIIGCEKVLTSAPGLKYHIKSHNGPERPFLCDRCHKTFKSANGLKYHCEKTKCDCCTQPHTNTDELSEEDIPHIEPVYLNPLDTVHKLDLSLLNTPQKSLTIACQSSQEGDGLSGHGTVSSAQVDRLTELAIIATSPQSPLMQKSLPVKIDQSRSSVVRSLEKSLHPYSRPPDFSPPWSTSSPEFSSTLHCNMSAPSSVESMEAEDPVFDIDTDAVVTSSSPFPACPQEELTSSSTWTHSWPTAVWQCFIKDCKIKFLSGPRVDDWQSAQDLAERENLTATATCLPSEIQTISYAENGLRLLETSEIKYPELRSCHLVELRLTPDLSDQSDMLAQCPLDHPFFVRNKGWSSLEPSSTADHYGIPCRELQSDDICLSPSHPDATFTEDVFKSFQSHAFTSMDTSAVFALSNMKKQRLDQELSPKHTPDSPGKRSPTKYPGEGDRAKRPMNSFMLFARKYRLELTQKFPGRDNRAISVMLGDRWKRMKTEERDLYAQEAKVLAEEQKKINPDCWKRKRSSVDPP